MATTDSFQRVFNTNILTEICNFSTLHTVRNRRIRHNRVDANDVTYFCTSKTLNSKLWFINDTEVSEAFLGYLAKYIEKYEVICYGFVIMGNHWHGLFKFPKGKKSDFFRDLNARFAEIVRQKVPSFEGGPLWGRRYSSEYTPLDIDVEDRLYYLALQAVNSGLTQRIADYNGYNSFYDGSIGKVLTFKVVKWDQYNKDRKRLKQEIFIEDYTDYFDLKYERLPGLEHLSHKRYKERLHKKCSEQREKILKKREKQGKGFLGPEQLSQIRVGSSPKETKKSRRKSKRPIVLTRCLETKKRILDWYFAKLSSHAESSWKYRYGVDTVFPSGTYPPPGCTIYERELCSYSKF